MGERRKFTVPQQDIRLESKTSQAGKPFQLTHFRLIDVATGKEINPCQTFGDKKALLEEKMKSQEQFELETHPDNEKGDNVIVYQEKWSNYSVNFTRGAGGNANYRGGGGGRQWVPNGYKGKAIRKEQYLQENEEILNALHNQMRKALGFNITKESPIELQVALLEQLASSARQYWISVEKNLTFPVGAAPDGASTAATTPPGQGGGAGTGTGAGSGSALPPPPTDPGTLAALEGLGGTVMSTGNAPSEETLHATLSDYGKDMLKTLRSTPAAGMDEFRQLIVGAPIPPEDKSVLFKAHFDRRNELGAAGA